MGKTDIVTKDYTEDNRVLADAFNVLVYEGKPVIRPEKLRPLDPTMIGVPYNANETELPVQKLRDSLKCLTIMEDDNATYLLLGLENQTNIHYAMPVRDMLYDALQYTAQVEKITKERRNTKDPKTVSGKKLSGAEYLSGFGKDDKLMPIITAVLYFGEGKWDGPRSLHEMLALHDPKLLSFVSDYKMNLITPEDTPDEIIDRLDSSLREVLYFIKYSKDKAKLMELTQTDPRFKNLERKAARVIKTVTGVEVDVENEEEPVNMCQAMRELLEDANNEGRLQNMQDTARRMLKEDSFSNDFIAQMTGLSVDAVQALAAEKS